MRGGRGGGGRNSEKTHMRGFGFSSHCQRIPWRPSEPNEFQKENSCEMQGSWVFWERERSENWFGFVNIENGETTNGISEAERQGEFRTRDQEQGSNHLCDYNAGAGVIDPTQKEASLVTCKDRKK